MVCNASSTNRTPIGVIAVDAGNEAAMTGDDTTPNAPDPETVTGDLDPSALKDALGRTGRMLQTAGLPFEEDEFEDDGDSNSSSSTGGSEGTGDAA